MHPAKNSVLPLDSEMQDSCSVTEEGRVTGIPSPALPISPSADEGMYVCVRVVRKGIESIAPAAIALSCGRDPLSYCLCRSFPLISLSPHVVHSVSHGVQQLPPVLFLFYLGGV